MVWPSLISLSVTPGPFSAIAGIASMARPISATAETASRFTDIAFLLHRKGGGSPAHLYARYCRRNRLDPNRAQVTRRNPATPIGITYMNAIRNMPKIAQGAAFEILSAT